jgi:GGDEF domain-containing protein
MLKAPSLPNEAERLISLRALCLLDTAPEERFDRVTRLACKLFSVPIASVTLVDKDRQWFKSAQGLDARETARDISFCGHAIASSEPLVVQDAQNDVRFADNPLVVGKPHIRFYAGAPVAAPNGSQVGTVCLISDAPRQFSAHDMTTLRALARMVEADLAAVDTRTTDPVTQLSSRLGFQMMGRYVMQHCRQMELPLQLLCLQVGLVAQPSRGATPLLLAELAPVLYKSLRGADLLGRIGESELALLLSCPPESVGVAINRLNQTIQRFNFERPTDQQVTLKVGCTSCDWDLHRSVEDLMSAATERSETDPDYATSFRTGSAR